MAGGENNEEPISLFYSYSHRDEAFRDELETHLSFLRRSKLIAGWHDRMIGAGDEWKRQIDSQLAAADVILLLVSADFIASDYCWGEEMAKALARHQLGEARVIPVILRPCRWQNTPLGSLQAVPKDGKPVSAWPNHDEAFDQIATAIERTIAEVRRQRQREAERLRRQTEEERKRAEACRAAEEKQREAERLRQQQAARSAAEVGAAGARQAGGEDEGGRRQRLRVSAAIGLVALAVGGAVFALSERQPKRPVVVAPKEEEKAQAAAPAPSPVAKAQPLKPLDSFADCPDCPQMVVIPAGSFMMGSPDSEAGRDSDEGPQQKVTIRPFAIGKDEVTFDQWDACVATGGCSGYKPADNDWGRGRQPVINVSWQDAQAYVSWLAQQTGKPYRLPSEAEWEYTARAGTTTPFALPAPKGSIDIAGNGLANCNGCGSQWDNKRTAPIGSFPTNAWGLYDMHGNVWEWVEDIYHNNYQGAPADGSAWTDGEGKKSSRDRVNRGGSWVSIPGGLRSANRDGNGPGYRSYSLGFRVARTLD